MKQQLFMIFDILITILIYSAYEFIAYLLLYRCFDSHAQMYKFDGMLIFMLRAIHD